MHAARSLPASLRQMPAIMREGKPKIRSRHTGSVAGVLLVLLFLHPAGPPSLDPPAVSVGENPLPERKGRERE